MEGINRLLSRRPKVSNEKGMACLRVPVGFESEELEVAISHGLSE